MKLKDAIMLVGRILIHPATIFVGIGAGIYIGLNNKELSEVLLIPGDIYLSLLQMCVLPIMISAVISSIGRLFISGHATKFILRVVTVFILGMVIAGSVGIVIGFLGQPGSNFDRDKKIKLSRQIAKSEQNFENKIQAGENKSILNFMQKMIPKNVFGAISEGKNLPVLFFCVIVGVALGRSKSEKSETVLVVADAIYEALLKVISWIMYGLPFGLCFLFAGQMSRAGIDIIGALLKLIVFLYIASFLMITLYSIVIWRCSGTSFAQSFFAFKETLLVAMGTSNSFAAIPSALNALHANLNFEKETTDLIIPLGINLNPHGSILHFAMTAMFMSQLYEKSLGAGDIFTTIIIVIVAAVASAGVPGIAALSMLVLILEPLGLPVVISMILLTAIDPIVDPILTVVNVYGNCATTAIITKRHLKKP